MSTSTGFSINFAKVIEQAERELYCEPPKSCGESCRDCGACVMNKLHHMSSTSETSEGLRLHAAAVSTD